MLTVAIFKYVSLGTKTFLSRHERPRRTLRVRKSAQKLTSSEETANLRVNDMIDHLSA